MPFKSKALPFLEYCIPFTPYQSRLPSFTNFIMSLPCFGGWWLGLDVFLKSQV